jgi:hypothetical protein
MKGPNYISIVLWVALLGSILLNVGLLYRLNCFRKTSIDLRHVSVSVRSDPPDILDAKSQFEKGDKVISIIDTTNSNNMIVMFFGNLEEHGSNFVRWNAITGGSFIGRGISVYRLLY